MSRPNSPLDIIYLSLVGSDSDARASLAPGGIEIDLRGRTVVPGFTDAHLHFMWYGLSLKRIDLAAVPTLEDALARVRLVNFGIPNLSTFALLGRSAANPEPAGGHLVEARLLSNAGQAVTVRYAEWTWRVEGPAGKQTLLAPKLEESRCGSGVMQQP